MAILTPTDSAVGAPSLNLRKANQGRPNANAQDVADEFGVSTKTVRRWAADGRIRAHRIGPKLIRYDLAEVREDLLGRGVA